MGELHEADKVLGYVVHGANRLEKHIKDEVYFHSTKYVFTPDGLFNEDLIAEVLTKLSDSNLVNEFHDEFRSGCGVEIFYYTATIEGIRFSKNEGFVKNEAKRLQKEEKDRFDFVQSKRNVYFWLDPKFWYGVGIGLIPYIFTFVKEHFHF